MSAGNRRVEVAERESRKSEFRRRKRAVWVRDWIGMLRALVVVFRKVLSQFWETGRDLVLRRWWAIWSWGFILVFWEW